MIESEGRNNADVSFRTLKKKTQNGRPIPQKPSMDLWARAHAAVGLTPPQEEEEEAGLLASLQEAASISRTQVCV